MSLWVGSSELQTVAQYTCRELIHSEDLQTRITAAWADLCDHLEAKANEIATKGDSVCDVWVTAIALWLG